jgi:hypothetical protein
MDVAKAFPTAGKEIETIDVSAIYLLAAPSTPPSARDAAIARAADGEHITKAEAEAMVAMAKTTQMAEFEEKASRQWHWQ